MVVLNILKFASLSVALAISAGAPASAKVVGEPALASTCAKTVATMLAVDISRVSTLPTELTKGTYHVYGQVDNEGGQTSIIECVFDSKKTFKTIIVDGKSYKVAAPANSAASTSGTAPQAASQSCVKQMGGPVQVQQVSPLKPGYYEIMMKDKNTGRRVACTVSDKGVISDWVELN